MTTRERIFALLDAGFEPHAIAAILDIGASAVTNTLATPAFIPEDPAGGGGSAVIRDDFTNENQFARYIADQGTKLAGLHSAPDGLHTSDALDHSFHLNATVGDAKHLVKFTRHADTFLVYLMLKYLDDQNYLMAQVNVGGLTIYTNIGGAITAHGAIGIAPKEGAPTYLVARQQNDYVVVEMWNDDPRLFTPYEVVNRTALTLEGAAKAKFGANQQGAPGLRLTDFETGAFQNTDAVINEWVVVGLDALDHADF